MQSLIKMSLNSVLICNDKIKTPFVNLQVNKQMLAMDTKQRHNQNQTLTQYPGLINLDSVRTFNQQTMYTCIRIQTKCTAAAAHLATHLRAQHVHECGLLGGVGVDNDGEESLVQDVEHLQHNTQHYLSILCYTTCLPYSCVEASRPRKETHPS